MDPPPTYPRIAHLIDGRGTSDDASADQASIDVLLGGDVVVEEKLDGANVVVWPDGHRLECSLRSGPRGTDRAGQLGPLRAWVAEHSDSLRSLLGDNNALYAEWLLLAHSVAYDRLPTYLIALDLWSALDGFVAVDGRNEGCALSGIATPPELWRGRAPSVASIEAWLGRAVYGKEPAEGVVVRTIDGRAPRLVKLLRPGFDRIGDEAWRSGRPRNRLAIGASSWH